MARPRPTGLQLRKHADKSAGGDRPDGGWPLAGVSIVGDVPASTMLTPAFVEVGKIEGWVETEGDRVVYRPAGPANDRMQSRHTFVHYDTVILKTLDGVVRFKVTHQPDKYADGDGASDRTKVTDDHYTAGRTRVDNFYRLELEG
jgi:hypothetical protein